LVEGPPLPPLPPVKPYVPGTAVSGLARVSTDPTINDRYRSEALLLTAAYLHGWQKEYNKSEVLEAATMAANIGDIEEEAKTILPDVKAALSDRDTEVRRTAAEMLLKFGVAAKGALPELRKALSDGDIEVRKVSARTILKIGPDDLRIEAARTAAAMGRKAIGLYEDLVMVQSDLNNDPKVRRAAGEAIEAIDKDLRDSERKQAEHP
jgi:HEAT repeat protein